MGILQVIEDMMKGIIYVLKELTLYERDGLVHRLLKHCLWHKSDIDSHKMMPNPLWLTMWKEKTLR